MRILKLTVEGFRSLKNVTWEPGRLNVLIGPNGTGKSNLLRLLEFVSVAARGGLSKHVQAAGGMEPLLWDGRAKELSVSLKMSPADDHRDEEKDSLTYKLLLGRIGQTSSYRIDHELLWKPRFEPGEDPEPLKLMSRRPGHARVLAPEAPGAPDWTIFEKDLPED